MRTTEKKKKGTKGRKVLMTFGILFIVAGVFTASFATSFQVMIQAAQSKPDEGTLESENRKLREENQLLQDRITILESEIQTETPKEPVVTEKPETETPSATKKPATTAKPTATAAATQKPTATQKPSTTPASALVE